MYTNYGSFQRKIWSTEQCLHNTERVPRCHVSFFLLSFWILVFIFKILTILLTVLTQTCKLFFSPQSPAALEIQNTEHNNETEMNVEGNCENILN